MCMISIISTGKCIYDKLEDLYNSNWILGYVWLGGFNLMPHACLCGMKWNWLASTAQGVNVCVVTWGNHTVLTKGCWRH